MSLHPAKAGLMIHEASKRKPPIASIAMNRDDQIFEGKDGSFHYIDWGGSGPVAHFAHATGLCAGTYTPLAKKLRSRLKMVGMDDRGFQEQHTTGIHAVVDDSQGMERVAKVVENTEEQHEVEGAELGAGKIEQIHFPHGDV